MSKLKEKKIENIIGEYFKWNTLTERQKRRLLYKTKNEIFSWIKSFVIAFVLFIFVFSVLLVNAKVPSSSMEPTLMTNTRLIANRLAYSFGNEVEYNDIIIFPAPDQKDILYIKRVIGKSGDIIQIIDGITYRNGDPIEEPYVNTQTGNYGPYVVPNGKIFVMGDNRNHSYDARFWENKYVDTNDIIGKAIFTYAPLKEIKLLK